MTIVRLLVLWVFWRWSQLTVTLPDVPVDLRQPPPPACLHPPVPTGPVLAAPPVAAEGRRPHLEHAHLRSPGLHIRPGLLAVLLTHNRGMLAGSRTEPMQKITLADAKERGLTVDTHCVPAVAYRGARFDPSEIFEIEPPDWKALLEDLVEALSTPGFVLTVARRGGKARVSQAFGKAVAALRTS